jgi:hypothetical protein
MNTIQEIGKNINDCGTRYVAWVLSFVSSSPPSPPQTKDQVWNKVIHDISSQSKTKCVNIETYSSVDVITDNDNFHSIERYLNSINRCQLVAKSSSAFQKNQTFSCVGEVNDFLVNIVNREIKS